MTATLNTKNNHEPSRRILLVSVPRTASNLLLKILNIPNQPGILTNPRAGYFFHGAFEAAAKNGRLEKPLSQWTAEEKSETKAAFQDGLDELEAYTTRARAENKTMFAKEHAFWFLNPGAFTGCLNNTDSTDDLSEFHVSVPEYYGSTQTFSTNNNTVFSDEYLRTWRLAFIIRHPALAWPSMYRAMQKMSKAGFVDDDGVKGISIANMTLEWTRKLYDWCSAQPDESVTPLVIDANDVILNPGAVAKFCEMAGLDAASMQFEWSGATKCDGISDCAKSGDAHEEKRRQGHAIFLSTLNDSTGVVKDKAQVVDIDTEVAKWRVEFGDEIAGMIEKATRDSMSDYEYLKEHSITV